MLPTTPYSPEGLAQVQRLAAELAARMRYAQIVERPLPSTQIEALVAAARLLQERGEPWPEIVGEVLKQVADDLSKDSAQTSEPSYEPEGRSIVTSLHRFFTAFRREPARSSED